MGNHVDICDGNDNQIGYCVHSMLCGMWAAEVVKKYIPDWSMFVDIEENWGRLVDIYPSIADEDKVIILHFLNDDVHFDESDIEPIKKAITNYPSAWPNKGPLKHLEDCIELINKHGKIRYIYRHTTMAMTVTKA